MRTYNDDPANGSPRASKEEDVEADESDEDFVSDLVIGGDSNDGDDELAETHSDSSEQ